MSAMRYVIMANGKGIRWGGHLGIPKNLITVEGETLLARIVRQIHEHTDASAAKNQDQNKTQDQPQNHDAEIIISSADPRCETPGAVRHVPERNEVEIDRYPPELVTTPVCFLYGDTYYTDTAIEKIVTTDPGELLFFGDAKSIVGVKVGDPELMLRHASRVRDLVVSGELNKGIGWQLYQSYEGLEFTEENVIAGDFVDLTGLTAGFNTPEDFDAFTKNGPTG